MTNKLMKKAIMVIAMGLLGLLVFSSFCNLTIASAYTNNGIEFYVTESGSCNTDGYGCFFSGAFGTSDVASGCASGGGIMSYNCNPNCYYSSNTYYYEYDGYCYYSSTTGTAAKHVYHYHFYADAYAAQNGQAYMVILNQRTKSFWKVSFTVNNQDPYSSMYVNLYSTTTGHYLYTKACSGICTLSFGTSIT